MEMGLPALDMQIQNLPSEGGPPWIVGSPIDDPDLIDILISHLIHRRPLTSQITLKILKRAREYSAAAAALPLNERRQSRLFI